MTCDDVERGELAEHYILGRLGKDEQEAFEDHYFNCSRCLERLRAVEVSRAVLARESLGDGGYWWRRAAAGLAAAATLVLAIRFGPDIWSRAEPPRPTTSRPDVSLPAPAAPDAAARPVPGGLGQIELPPYTPPRLRAATSEAQRVFGDAMTAYRAGNCETAIAGLRRALAIDGTLMPARFYLGACELRAGQVEEAVPTLQRVIAAGESPYLEDARFLLAKARIRQGDMNGAREELRRVVSLNGDRRDEARRLLEQLR